MPQDPNVSSIAGAINNFTYEYSIKDHLGNSRVMFSDLNGNGQVTESEIIQVEHYYPFGMSQEGHGNAIISETAYTYNGKELNSDFGLDLHDYGARWYDAAIGRWHGVDPLAEAFIVHSPYNYGVNNPIMMVDPDGRSSEGFMNDREADRRDKRGAFFSGNLSGYKTGAEQSERAQNEAEEHRNRETGNGSREVTNDDIAASYEVTGATAFGYKVLNKDGSVFKDVVEGYYLQTKTTFKIQSGIGGKESGTFATYATAYYYQTWIKEKGKSCLIPLQGLEKSYTNKQQNSGGVLSSITFHQIKWDIHQKAFILPIDVSVGTAGGAMTAGGDGVVSFEGTKNINGSSESKLNVIIFRTIFVDESCNMRLKVTVQEQNMMFSLGTIDVRLKTMETIERITKKYPGSPIW
jgi:RHS repeat-associated protein